MVGAADGDVLVRTGMLSERLRRVAGKSKEASAWACECADSSELADLGGVGSGVGHSLFNDRLYRCPSVSCLSLVGLAGVGEGGT